MPKFKNVHLKLLFRQSKKKNGYFTPCYNYFIIPEIITVEY